MMIQKTKGNGEAISYELTIKNIEEFDKNTIHIYYYFHCSILVCCVLCYDYCTILLPPGRLGIVFL